MYIREKELKRKLKIEKKNIINVTGKSRTKKNAAI